MNQKLVARVNAAMVGAYKALGTTLLACILLGLVSYLGTHGFFLVSRGWLAPTIVSPTDEKILELNAQLAHQLVERGRLESERREMQARLEEAGRTLAAEQAFQERFLQAMRAEKGARGRELARLQALERDYGRAKQDIQEAHRAFSGLEMVRGAALREASLLTQEDWLSTNRQLAGIAQVDLALEERSVELTTRLESVRRQLQGLEAVERALRHSGGQEDREVRTPEVLALEQSYLRSATELARAHALRASLEQSLVTLDAALERTDQLIASIRSSPYLKAIEGNVTVAFVPYENLENARPGAPLYGCALKLLWCREVGLVSGVLEGEVVVQHPIRHLQLRGMMVEIELREGTWARQALLHAGRPPLLL